MTQLLQRKWACTAFAMALAASGTIWSPATPTHQASSAAIPTEIRVGWPEKVATLNPDRSTETAPLMIFHLIGGTLNELKPDASGTTPGLAEKTSVSSDGLRYVFTLRPHLRFSDGSPLTSADVKATFVYKMRDKAYPFASDLASWKAVQAPSPTTVVVVLSKPEPSLPDILAAPWNMIFPAAGLARGTAFFNQPVSAGPYEVASYSGNGNDVVLKRNNNYYGAKPIVARFHYMNVVDPNTRLIQLQGGQLDFAGAMPPSLLPVLKGTVSSDVVRQHGAFFIWMSDRTPPLSDVRVRKAISWAIDRSQLNRVIWFGKTKPLGGLFPSTMKEHVANIPTTRNVTMAKQLLRGTSCATSCSFTIMVRNGRPIDLQAATIIQQNLKDIGINVKIEGVDNSIATQRELNGTFGSECEALDLPLDIPDTYLTLAVLSTGGINALFSGYKSAVMDAAVEQALVSKGAQRSAAIARVNAIFARDLPYLPLLDDAIVVGYRSSMRQFAWLTAAGEFEIARQG